MQIDVDEHTGRENCANNIMIIFWPMGESYANCQEQVLVIFHIHIPVIVNKFWSYILIQNWRKKITFNFA